MVVVGAAVLATSAERAVAEAAVVMGAVLGDDVTGGIDDVASSGALDPVGVNVVVSSGAVEPVGVDGVLCSGAVDPVVTWICALVDTTSDEDKLSLMDSVLEDATGAVLAPVAPELVSGSEEPVVRPGPGECIPVETGVAAILLEVLSVDTPGCVDEPTETLLAIARDVVRVVAASTAVLVDRVERSENVAGADDTSGDPLVVCFAGTRVIDTCLDTEEGDGETGEALPWGDMERAGDATTADLLKCGVAVRP